VPIVSSPVFIGCRGSQSGYWGCKIKRRIPRYFHIPKSQNYTPFFVDDVFLFCCGRRGDAEKLSQILDLFGRATGMKINGKKYTLSPNLMEEEEINTYKELFPFEFRSF
jgi:hypothetical protein